MFDLVRPALPLPETVGDWVRLRALSVAGPVAAGLDAERGLCRIPLPSGASGGSVGRFEKATSLALSADGSVLVVGLPDRAVRLEWPSGVVLDEWEIPVGVVQVAADPAGEVVVAATDGRVWMSGVATDTGWGAHDVHQRRVVAVARSGRRVVSVDAGGQALSLDLQTENGQMTGGLSEVAAVAFEPGGTAVVLAQTDGTVLRWALDETDAIAPLFRVDGPVTALSVSDKEILVAHGTVTAWSRSGGARTVFVAHRGRSVGLGFDEQGQAWTAARGEGLVGLADGHSTPPPWVGHRAGVRAVLPHRGGVWTASRDGTLRRWRLDGRPLGLRDRGVPGQQALVPLGEERLLVGDTAGLLHVLSRSGQPEGAGRLAHEGPVTALGVLSSGLVVSGGADGVLRIWDPDLTPVLERKDHSNRLRCLCVLEDDLVVTGGYDGAVRLVPALGGPPLLSAQPHSRPVLGVARVGDTVASASLDGTLRFVSSSGEERGVLELDAEGLVGLLRTPEGGLLAFGRGGSLFAIADGACVQTLPLAAPADGAAWLGDGRLLVGDQRGGLHELVWRA